jgi:hypothetical protein
MNKIISTLLIAAVLASTVAFGEDNKFHVSMENGKQRVDFSLNGNNHCVMIDDKITCAPMKQAPIRVASSESN